MSILHSDRTEWLHAADWVYVCDQMDSFVARESGYPKWCFGSVEAGNGRLLVILENLYGVYRGYCGGGFLQAFGECEGSLFPVLETDEPIRIGGLRAIQSEAVKDIVCSALGILSDRISEDALGINAPPNLRSASSPLDEVMR